VRVPSLKAEKKGEEEGRKEGKYKKVEKESSLTKTKEKDRSLYGKNDHLCVIKSVLSRSPGYF